MEVGVGEDEDDELEDVDDVDEVVEDEGCENGSDKEGLGIDKVGMGRMFVGAGPGAKTEERAPGNNCLWRRRKGMSLLKSMKEK